MSGGIIFGHEALTNARNRKENSVISLEPSILSGVSTAIRGSRVQQFTWELSNAFVVRVGGGTFLKPGSCSRGKMGLIVKVHLEQM